MEYSAHKSMIKGSSLATGTGRKKILNIFFLQNIVYTKTVKAIAESMQPDTVMILVSYWTWSRVP